MTQVPQGSFHSPTQPVPRRAPRVLIVEDTDDSRRILWDVLSHAGFVLLEAADGESGVALATQHRPDLILMDIQLPLIDGLEATRRIKADPRLAHIPVIAVTARASGQDEQSARRAGCCAFVPKPFSPRDLLATVREHLPGA